MLKTHFIDNVNLGSIKLTVKKYHHGIPPLPFTIFFENIFLKNSSDNAALLRLA